MERHLVSLDEHVYNELVKMSEKTCLDYSVLIFAQVRFCEENWDTFMSSIKTYVRQFSEIKGEREERGEQIQEERGELDKIFEQDDKQNLDIANVVRRELLRLQEIINNNNNKGKNVINEDILKEITDLGLTEGEEEGK